jgi:hypothetical protein
LHTTDVPQHLGDKLLGLNSRLTGPESVQQRLLFTRVADNTSFVHPLRDSSPPNIDSNSFMPDLPHKACLFFPSLFSPHSIPTHLKVMRKNVPPLGLSKHKGKLPLLQDAFADLGIIL